MLCRRNLSFPPPPFLPKVNPNAELLNKSAALFMSINAAKGLEDVLKSNLGPKGTIKMLVGGAGDIKLTKVKLARHFALARSGPVPTLSHARGAIPRSGAGNIPR